MVEAVCHRHRIRGHGPGSAIDRRVGPRGDVDPAAHLLTAGAADCSRAGGGGVGEEGCVGEEFSVGPHPCGHPGRAAIVIRQHWAASISQRRSNTSASTSAGRAATSSDTLSASGPAARSSPRAASSRTATAPRPSAPTPQRSPRPPRPTCQRITRRRNGAHADTLARPPTAASGIPAASRASALTVRHLSRCRDFVPSARQATAHDPAEAGTGRACPRQ